MSARQAKQAIRVANVLADVFDVRRSNGGSTS